LRLHGHACRSEAGAGGVGNVPAARAGGERSGNQRVARAGDIPHGNGRNGQAQAGPGHGESQRGGPVADETGADAECDQRAGDLLRLFRRGSETSMPVAEEGRSFQPVAEQDVQPVENLAEARRLGDGDGVGRQQTVSGCRSDLSEDRLRQVRLDEPEIRFGEPWMGEVDVARSQRIGDGAVDDGRRQPAVGVVQGEIAPGRVMDNARQRKALDAALSRRSNVRRSARARS
jgi:hypothetical protein